MITVSILTENTAGGKFLAEHGLSYLINIDGELTLFDTGHSDVFLKNAARLGIDIHDKIKTIVLSHGHWDHGDGLQFISGQKLITHPESFIKRFRKRDHSPIGLALTKKEIKNKFNLQETKEPVQITNNMLFMGEIPRLNNFESQSTPFELEDFSDDFIPDDSALVAIKNNELVIITGCSHSGICNICEYAKKITGISKIKTVMGGFHLKYQDKQTQNTLEYFKKNEVEILLPSHCTALPALALFYQEFNIQQVKTGMTFEF